MILSLNPPPFPGDDTEVLVCEGCGHEYTMREYRAFAWVEHSRLCVTCGAADMRRKIREMLAELEP